MAVTLKKGQGVCLKKEVPNLKRILVGLGWDPKKEWDAPDIDIDASVICMTKERICECVVCYHHLYYASGAIKHYGDNLTGSGDGDDEQIEINLDKIPENINKLAIIINIYRAYGRKQHFGKVDNCFVHALDLDSRKELVHYNVDGDFDGMTGIFVADIERHEGDWKFKAIGEGVKVSDIDEMVNIEMFKRATNAERIEKNENIEEIKKEPKRKLGILDFFRKRD